MSLTYTIDNKATPALTRLIERIVNKVGMHQAMADGARILIRQHFADRVKTERNRFGARPQFWGRMYRGTYARATAEAAQVAMPREVAQRYFGGLIRPTGGKKFLTLPVHPRAYRKRAGEFDDLTFIRQEAGPNSVALLVRKNAKHTIGEVYYVLVKQVTQKPDPTVLPIEKDINDALEAALSRFLQRN